jgi:hypothetical protein
MSGAGDAGDEDPIRLENILDDIENRLGDVTDGVYAITHMTRDTFNHPIEADGARLGIHYVALKLEEELSTLRDRAAESRAAWQRERPESWQDGPASPKPEPQPRRYSRVADSDIQTRPGFDRSFFYSGGAGFTLSSRRGITRARFFNRPHLLANRQGAVAGPWRRGRTE